MDADELIEEYKRDDGQTIPLALALVIRAQRETLLAAIDRISKLRGNALCICAAENELVRMVEDIQ